MRAFVWGVVALLVSSGAAQAYGDDVMAGYYGNTVISKGANGESRTHYKKDGTLDAVVSGALGSLSLNGTWKLDEKGQLCRTYSNVPAMLPIPNPLCTPVTAHKPGDTWTVQIGTQSRTVTMVAGIQK